MGRGGEGTIEVKGEGEKKKTMQVGMTEKRGGGGKRRGKKKKKRMQGVCFEPLPC